MRHTQSNLASAFHPAFGGSRQERAYVLDALGTFYVEEWFTSVLFRVKGGKEATVYALRAHPATGRDLLAAKVFRPRKFRAMRNDALYKQGRQVLDAEGKADRRTRTARALAKGTRFGKLVDSISWCQHEMRTLETLFAAGVEVPRPLAAAPHAILMEFVGDETGAAPTLHGVDVEPDVARGLRDRLFENLDRMLGAYVVHADLSAYNVLYDGDDLRIIDVPQAVDALAHPLATSLFQRDVRHLCTWLDRQGLREDADAIALELWSRHFG